MSTPVNDSAAEQGRPGNPGEGEGKPWSPHPASPEGRGGLNDGERLVAGGADSSAGVSRREAVRVTAAAAAAGGAAAVLAGCRTTPGAEPRANLWRGPTARRGPLRVGLVGCGGRGTGAAKQALAADAGAVLVAAGDYFPERVDACLGRLTAVVEEERPGRASAQIDVPKERRFGGLEACAGVLSCGVDVVLLATPPGFRPRQVEAAVEAWAHMFCEKPVAVDSPGLRRVLGASRRARERGLSIVSGFCWRYAEAEREIFRRINDGAIGDIVTVHTTFHTGTLSPRPRQEGWSDLEWQLRNWWHFAWLSGDHIVEQAVHSIDRLAWATGDRTPSRCTALGGRAARVGAESGHVFDHFAVVYEYEGEEGKSAPMRCFHTCRQIDACPHDNTDYIYGTKGSATVNGWVPTHVIRDLRGRERWKYAGERGDMYQNEHDVLFRAVRSGRPVNDGEFMCRSTMMALMGRMAAYTESRPASRAQRPRRG